MTLPSGIPTLRALDDLLDSAAFREHEQANRDFLERHGPAMKSYRAKWEFDPYKLWSRRWEYPYIAGRIVQYAKQHPTESLRLLDAGSGVTYLPYYLCDRVPNLSVVAFDYDTSYVPMFEAINHTEGHQRVQFRTGMMQKLPFDNASVDIIACVSVLEHTDDYDAILSEFDRVLKPGGQLALTFDLSLDGKFELSKPMATKLLARILKTYSTADAVEPLKELDAMDDPAPLLSTDAIKKSNPELLPWRHPLLKAVKDLLEGHGWTGGFRSKSVFCMDGRRKALD